MSQVFRRPVWPFGSAHRFRPRACRRLFEGWRAWEVHWASSALFRTVQASMNTGEVQRRAESEVGDTIAMGFGNSLDHAVETEPAQVIGHPSLRDHVGRLPGEQSELLSQITIGETAGKQTKPDQQMPERQDTQIGGA